MLDHDWPAVKRNMQQWLYSNENKISLTELNQPTVK
jgi:hypothetical protein